MDLTTGEILSKTMEEKGVSVRELHRRTNLSISSIRKLRTGDMTGNLYSWNLVANALNVTVDHFLEGRAIEDGRREANMRCWWCDTKMFWYEDIELETGLAAVLTCPKCGAVATVEQPTDLDQ